MKTLHGSTQGSARIALALALLLSGILATGTAAADKQDKGGKNGNDNRRSEQRDKHDNRGNDGGKAANSGDRNGSNGKHAKDAHRFEDRHRTVVHNYYVRDSQNGRCPPGLAKKHNGCMPPGQARKWHIGQPLPREVIYYNVPQALVVQIGQPPSGHRYVRVAGDILMLAIGTGMVVDAIQNLGRS